MRPPPSLSITGGREKAYYLGRTYRGRRFFRTDQMRSCALGGASPVRVGGDGGGPVRSLGKRTSHVDQRRLPSVQTGSGSSCIKGRRMAAIRKAWTRRGNRWEGTEPDARWWWRGLAEKGSSEGVRCTTEVYPSKITYGSS